MAMKCRTCGNEKKEGVDWYNETYCSGKCAKADGQSIPSAPVHAQMTGVKASLEDYRLDWPKGLGERDKHHQRIKGRMPKRYRRRFDPEKLNWGEPMNAPDLKQAGLRANRKPIPGDFDYEEDKNLTNDGKWVYDEQYTGRREQDD